MNGFTLLILALCWIVPDHFPPWTAFHTEVPAFAAAAIGLGVNWGKSATAIKLPAAIGLLFALGVIASMQWLTGHIPYGGDALVAIAYLGTVACAWSWGYQWQSKDQQFECLHHVCVLLVFAGLITTFQILTQWLQVEYAMNDWVLEGLHAGRPRANVGQPNQAATVLVMGSVAAAILMQRARICSVVMWATLVMLGLAITLTQSRTALLSAVLLTVSFHMFSSSPHKKGTLSRKLVWLWLCLLLTAAWSFPQWNLDVGASSLAIDQMNSVGTRLLIWKQLLIAIFQKPWVGWGWFQVASAQQAGALLSPGFEQTNYAHNIVLDLFLYVGVPLGCLVLILVGKWVWHVARNNKGRVTAVGGFFLLVPLATHSLLELPHAYAYFLVVAGLLLGAIDAELENRTSWTVGVSMWVIPAFAIPWTLFLLSLCYEYAKAEEDFRINRFENRRIGVTPAEYERPHLYLLTQLNELLQAMRLRAEPRMPPEDVELLLRVAKRYSWAPIQFRTALALALNGRPIEAAARMQVIKSLFSEIVYAEAKTDFENLRSNKYPELSLVSIP